MKIKHFDKQSNKWIIDGASNASNIELANPGFLNETGESVSVNNGFTKLDNRITQLEKNVAWIYLNGAKGGEGGGSGTGDEYTFVLDSNTFYSSTSYVDISLMIKSGNVKKSFTVIATNTDTSKQIGTWKIYSLTKTTITINNLSGTTNVELSAFDDNGNYVTPEYITIISGAISLTLNEEPPKTIYIDGVSQVSVNFKLLNNTNNPATYILKMNDSVVNQIDNITESSRDIVEYLRSYIFTEHTPTAGTKFYFEAYAQTTLNDDTLSSEIIKFNITVADGNKLTIVTDEITDFIPSDEPGQTIEDLTSFTKGSQLGFSYLLSYAPTVYTIFNVDYTVNLIKNEESVLLASGSTRVTKGITQRFILSTANLEANVDNEYINIHLSAYAVDAPSNVDAQDTADVYCRIVQGDSNILYANNDKKTLIAAFNTTIGNGFPNNTTGTWNYKWPSSGDFAYTGGFVNSPYLKEGININLTGVNGETSGFIQNSDGNSNSAIILKGESYGSIPELKYLMPDSDEVATSVFSTGFHLSLTYKAEYSSDSDLVLCSLGKYENNTLKTGYEISVSKVTCKIGTLDEISVNLPQNELLTVDLDISKETGINVWYFKIFVNGILSAVSRVSSYDWKFSLPLTLGCRNDNGLNTLFSNVNIYDLKLYTSSISEVAVVQNYISAVEQASLIKGEIDNNLDSELRSKNLFDNSGKCIIWNYSSDNNGGGDFISAGELYKKLVDNMEINTPYPIIMITETSPTSKFEDYSSYIYEEGNKDEIMAQTFPVNIKYHDKYNTAGLDIITPVGATEGVRIGLQGTSSLTYTSKNYELYMGDVDNTGKKLLFQPKDEWLPENEFTLKADVMDSAHANNVVIGKTINNLARSKFSAVPPMELGNDVWGGDVDKANEIKGKMKFTSEGFPVLLFITFASKKVKFCGIYNFNLGRYAFFNLGLKLLTDYTKETPDGPSLVKNYTEVFNYWDNNGGVYSMEINQNDSDAGAFQQDDLSIVKFMADSVYDSKNNTDSAYTHFQKFYTQMASMALTQIPKKRRNASNTSYEEIPGEYYYPASSSDYYSFSQSNKHLNWNNACHYYLFGLIFGMVDSMCKNLTLRNWGGDIWHTCFYDMDTAFGLNNAGQDTVYYYAHLHKYFNKIGNPTEPDFTKNVPDLSGRSYACYWNRIWEVLENLPTKDATGMGVEKDLETLYVELRRDIIRDPEEFIENQYVSYTNNTGAIVFNYDYKIKYFEKKIIYNSDGSLEDSTDFSQLKFLHGNRTISVKDWFVKRIYFLDSVYIKNRGDSNLSGITSPKISLWNSNKSFGGSGYFSSKISASSKMMISYSYAAGVGGSFWVDESDSEISLPMPGGQTTITIYGNPFITKFDNFKAFNWNTLTDINFPILEELDLSGDIELGSDFLTGGAYNPSLNKGLKSLKKLNLSGITITNNSYTLDLSGCSNLQEVDISNSSITNVILPTSAVLKVYKLANTAVESLTIENQSFLSVLDISGCNNLTSITIKNCPSLQTISVPQNVKTVNINSCETFSYLSIPYTSVNNSISNLSLLHIEDCPGMTNIELSGQNNPSLVLELAGAYNLERLNLSNITTSNIILAPKANFTTLKSLNISNTSIKSLNYDSSDNVDYLDLSNFPDLQDIQAYNCSELTKVVCSNNVDNPIELQGNSFKNCSNLTDLYGYFNIQGTEVFRGCTNFSLKRQDGEEFMENATNMSFSTISLYYTFEGCTSLTYSDFKYIMSKLNSTVTSIEGIFKGCTGINGAIWRDIFKPCPNLTSIKDAFNDTNISGIVYSRASNYSDDDISTYGIFDFCRNLIDAENAFSSTKLEWIDNNIFAPINGTTYSNLATIDSMFRNCTLLCSAKDTRADVIEEGMLKSDTFFSNLRNLINIYPKNVFDGCTKITMEIVNIEDNTLLFHTPYSNKKITTLDNSLYSGVKLVGEVKVNVFGGITKDLGDGLYIPTINSIHSPFSKSSGATIKLSEMGKIFENISNDLYQAVRIFSGLKCEESYDIIPDNIFKNCVNLNSIEGFFEGLNITNNGEKYNFPTSNMFEDCVSLKNISCLFRNCYNLKLSLTGEGFKNCKLENVSEAFSNSGVFGMIPYRLFFMVKDGQISSTITDISNVFKGCWCLGYDTSRTIDTDTVISQDLNIKVSWEDHIIKNKGNVVYYSVNKDLYIKGTNYDIDTRETIPNPDYIPESDNRPPDYDSSTPEYIDNPDYNPDEIAYDIWYLDGSGYWPEVTLDNDVKVYNRLKKRYFNDDDKQKLALTTEYTNITSETISGDEHFNGKYYQNYAIPTDYFRYCSNSCNLSNSLTGLFYEEQILQDSGTSADYTIVKTGKWDGIKGRIPPQIFKSLTGIINLDSVFKDTRFCPYVGLYMKVGEGSLEYSRGVLYPKELFIYNTSLQSISSIFENTLIDIGTDIDGSLFKYNNNLRSISRVWANCIFNKNKYVGSSTDNNYAQIPFSAIFKYNTNISDASGLFSVNLLDVDNVYGLKIIEDTLLSTCYKLQNIGSMFYYNTSMVGNVPLFKSTIYPILTNVSDYLVGCQKDNITNNSLLEDRLIPSSWKQQNA